MYRLVRSSRPGIRAFLPFLLIGANTCCLHDVCSSRARAVAELALPAMGGVTHLKFAPNGRLLFSGSRKDAAIVCWDIRRTKGVSDISERARQSKEPVVR